MFPSEKEVAMIRSMYPEGSRVRVHFMEDPHPIPYGTEGTVYRVDDAGTIHVDWDNGRRLGLVYGEDSFEKI